MCSSRNSYGYSRPTLRPHHFELLLVYLFKSNSSGSIHLKPLIWRTLHKRINYSRLIINMLLFLFWIIEFQMLIVGFSISIRNTKISTTWTFFKWYVHVRIWIKFGFHFCQITFPNLKLVRSNNDLDIIHNSLSYYF